MRMIGVLGVLALIGLSAPLPGETVRLRSGQVLVGKVEGEPDEKGLHFRRLDNGGLLEIEWRHLMPGDVRRLQQKFGLQEQAEEELLVPAQRFMVKPPGLPALAHTGLVVARTAQAIVLRARGVETPLPKDQIQGAPEWVQVPALEVYTPEELYQRQLQEIQPGEDPARHERLARALKAAGDYEKAREHFQKVLALDPEYRNKGAVENAIRQVEAALAHRDIDDLLKRVRQAQGVRDYKKAMAFAALLDEKAAEMPRTLRQVWLARKDKLERERRQWLASAVARNVYDQVRRSADVKALERDASPDAIKDYAQKEMGEAILGKVASLLEIEQDETAALWAAREELRTAAFQSATYGDGTFILPKEKAHQGTSLEGKRSGQKGPGGTAADQRAEQERRVREWLRQQAQRRQTGPQGKSGAAAEPQEQTPEEWWRKAKIPERKQWIMAFFAENSGLMKVKKVLATPCPTCGGTGQITGQNLSGEEVRQVCPECHGHQIRRSVSFF